MNDEFLKSGQSQDQFKDTHPDKIGKDFFESKSLPDFALDTINGLNKLTSAENSTSFPESENHLIEPKFDFESSEDSSGSKLTLEDIEADIEQNSISERLKLILETQKILQKRVESKIRFAQPILNMDSKPLIYPNTITTIQGKAGSHKSRLAEEICIALLKKGNTKDYINPIALYKNTFNQTYTVVYVDTERNLNDQYPAAIQKIKKRAGINLNDHSMDFPYITLLETPRKERFNALKEYIQYIRKSVQGHIVIVLDVSTDCIEDFNKTDKSLELIDYMNMLINKEDVSIIAIIHENPFNEKARGHFGTELMNKSSTVIQIGYAKTINEDEPQNLKSMILMKVLKNRSGERGIEFFLRFCEETKGLRLATNEEISTYKDYKRHKADVETFVEFIEAYFKSVDEVVSRPDLLNYLIKQSNASERTVENRLIKILEYKYDIKGPDEQTYNLVKFHKPGERGVFYKLKHVSETNSEEESNSEDED